MTPSITRLGLVSVLIGAEVTSGPDPVGSVLSWMSEGRQVLLQKLSGLKKKGMP